MKRIVKIFSMFHLLMNFERLFIYLIILLILTLSLDRDLQNFESNLHIYAIEDRYQPTHGIKPLSELADS